MGVADIGLPARTLGRGKLLHAQTRTTSLLAIDEVTFKLTPGEFTNAFRLTLQPRGLASTGSLGAHIDILINGQTPDQALMARYLNGSQVEVIILPGWHREVTIGVAGFTTGHVARAEVNYGIQIYQLDRVTRDEYLGSA